MREQKYVVFQRNGSEELYWNGAVPIFGGKAVKNDTGLVVESTAQAKQFDSAREAYEVVGFLVRGAYLPERWLDCRVGQRYISE